MFALAHKLNTASNHFKVYRARQSRPASNRLFSELTAQVPIVPGAGAILCEALWDHPHHWLRVAMLRNALADTYGRDLIGVHDADAPRHITETLRSLGPTQLAAAPANVEDRHRVTADKLLDGARTTTDILSLEIAPGYPAHFFYDGVLKAEKLGTLDPGTADRKMLRTHLAQALSYIAFYEAMFTRQDIRAVIVSHPTTVRFSTLVWAALSRGIPVFVINYRNQHVTIRKLASLAEYAGVAEDVPTIADRDGLSPDQRSRLIETGRTFLSALRAGKEGEINVTGAFDATRAGLKGRHNLTTAAGAEVDKPNIVVLTSCWPDFPNAPGRSYLSDHVDWFERTLAVASNAPEYNWYFKPHPAEEMYGKRTTLTKLLAGRTGANIFLWPETASGTDVLDCADCAVTAVGSVGFEYPALGARALVARETAYTGWGFSNFARDGKEYAAMLQRAASLPLATPTQREDALIYIALRLTAPTETQADGYKYPWGRLSYNLWPGLPDFIRANRANFDREIELMRRWNVSGEPSYSVFKNLHPDLWSPTTA